MKDMRMQHSLGKLYMPLRFIFHKKLIMYRIKIIEIFITIIFPKITKRISKEIHFSYVSLQSHINSEIEKRNPRKRVGSAEDIAGLAIFLCSRAGAYTVGETITSDGGIVKTATHNLS